MLPHGADFLLLLFANRFAPARFRPQSKNVDADPSTVPPLSEEIITVLGSGNIVEFMQLTHFVPNKHPGTSFAGLAHCLGDIRGGELR